MGDYVTPTHLTWDGTPGTELEEAVKGSRHYLDVLEQLHATIAPRRYLEIGVRHGASLRLAKCAAIGVDPAPEINVPLPPFVEIVAKTSDAYFASGDEQQGEPFDLVFIDGMHLSEFVLRDFINAEKRSAPSGMIVLDDVSPNHPAQAARKRRTRVWTGDVWRLIGVLRQHRPELTIRILDTYPSGLLLISNLDPRSSVLEERYETLVAEMTNEEPPPAMVTERTESWSADASSVDLLLADRGRCSKPRLSVVVAAHNMARELPRTLKTLAPGRQQDLAATDYEVIVVDNGSVNPLGSTELAQACPGVLAHFDHSGSCSPCRAINHAVRLARGEFVAIMIDGARMVSPAILELGLRALQLHERAVVGTLAFHLGSQVQMESVKSGYCQEVEDQLLSTVSWETDAYHLFSISVFAGSSSAGWLRTPAETNALFISKELWQEVGGFDEQFVSPGGGLVNLDLWKRLVEDERNYPVLLLGEATFHQVHGGIATNNLRHREVVADFHEEYRMLRGQEFTPPKRAPHFFGRIHQEMLESLRESIGSAADR